MVETNYTLNLEQLIKIAPNLKKYLWQKMMNTKAVNEKITTSIVLNISTTTMAIDDHMVVVQVQIIEIQLMMFSWMFHLG
jgi:hypothetical protein